MRIKSEAFVVAMYLVSRARTRSREDVLPEIILQLVDLLLQLPDLLLHVLVLVHQALAKVLRGFQLRSHLVLPVLLASVRFNVRFLLQTFYLRQQHALLLH